MLRDHRKNEENVTVLAGNIANHFNVDITATCIAGRQKHRSNPPAKNPSEFWNRSLIIPYLDSTISSLEVRFYTGKSLAFLLTHFHPSNIKDFSLNQWNDVISSRATWKTSMEKVNCDLKYGII